MYYIHVYGVSVPSLLKESTDYDKPGKAGVETGK